jgi:catalase-peroxidase
MKKVLLTTSLFLGLFSLAQETATCPVTGKTMSVNKENTSSGPSAEDYHASNGTAQSKLPTPSTKGSSNVDRNKQWWPNQFKFSASEF